MFNKAIKKVFEENEGTVFSWNPTILKHIKAMAGPSPDLFSRIIC